MNNKTYLTASGTITNAIATTNTLTTSSAGITIKGDQFLSEDSTTQSTRMLIHVECCSTMMSIWMSFSKSKTASQLERKSPPIPGINNLVYLPLAT